MAGPNYNEVMAGIYRDKVRPFFDKRKTRGFGGLDTVWNGLSERYGVRISGLFSELGSIASSGRRYEERLDGINTLCAKSLRNMREDIRKGSPTDGIREQCLAAVSIIIAEFQRIFVEQITVEERRRAFGK